MKSKSGTSKLMLISSMVIFGTIGVFRRYIPMSSALLALTRGFVGAAFLLLFVLLTGKKLSKAAIKKNFLLLFISGALIGFNWILLFEAYRFTTVATATLCYYMAPIFVVLVSPIFLKERLSLKKCICVFVALLGTALVSGVVGNGFVGLSEMKGVFLGLGAAALYACVVVINQKFREIGAFDKTVVQLAAAGIVLIPYVLLTEDFSAFSLTLPSLALVLTVCIVHTGIAYALYFGSMNELSGQTIALFSYIDPIVAVLLSAFFLHEALGITEALGAALVLGATFVSDFSFERRKTK